MTTPKSDIGHANTPIPHKSGGSDPEFYFPVTRASAHPSDREPIFTLPGRLLKLIRRG